MSIFRINRIFSMNFWIFRELFVCFVRSNFFHQTAWVAAIFLIRKSSKFEPSSRFFGRLKIFNFRDAHYLLHALTIENCDYKITTVADLYLPENDRRRWWRRRWRRIFIRFVRSKFQILFSEIDRAVAIQSNRKSSKSELSTRFFGHLKIFHSEKRFLRYKLTEIQIGSHS